MNKPAPYLVILLAVLLIGYIYYSKNQNTVTMEHQPGQLVLLSPDSALARAFTWAKGQALSYAHENDPVGKWYEAALPGRDAFCMRDVSHQAMGAHALGLQEHTKNMLKKFAENISESKDWCTYWEINKDNKPAPVDYRNDNEFWYNLPANFDVLSACLRMYGWSRDKEYLDDPVFTAFYEHTVTDYVTRWELEPEKFKTRKRFLNRESFDKEDNYQYCRGIPSYHEGDPGKTRLGVDLLAFMSKALRDYGAMYSLKGDSEADELWTEKGNAVRRFITRNYWNDDDTRYYDLMLTDGSFVYSGGMQLFVLYNRCVKEYYHSNFTIMSLQEEPAVNIEMKSYYPEVLYNAGENEAAYKTLLELCSPETERREYPEVSFSAVGAIVEGMFGITPAYGREGWLQTYPRLASETEWAELKNLPYHNNIIDIRHNGGRETILHNKSGRKIHWRAIFSNKYDSLYVDSLPVKAENFTMDWIIPASAVAVDVKPGETVTVSSSLANPRMEGSR